METALERVGGQRAALIGDSIWDCVAAGKAGVPCIGVRTGGFSEAELRDAGAVMVFEGLTDLGAALDDIPFSKP